MTLDRGRFPVRRRHRISRRFPSLPGERILCPCNFRRNSASRHCVSGNRFPTRLVPLLDLQVPVRQDWRDRAVPHIKTIVPAFPRDLFPHGAVRRVADDLIDSRNRHQVVPVHPKRPAEVLRATAIVSRAEDRIDDMAFGALHRLVATLQNPPHLGRIPSRTV